MPRHHTVPQYWGRRLGKWRWHKARLTVCLTRQWPCCAQRHLTSALRRLSLAYSQTTQTFCIGREVKWKQRVSRWTITETMHQALSEYYERSRPTTAFAASRDWNRTVLELTRENKMRNTNRSLHMANIWTETELNTHFCRRLRTTENPDRVERQKQKMNLLRPTSRELNRFFYWATACNATYGIFKAFLSVRLSVCQTRGLWQKQVTQLSQRDRAAGWVNYGNKWKTVTGRQYFTDIIGLSSTTVT